MALQKKRVVRAKKSDVIPLYDWCEWGYQVMQSGYVKTIPESQRWKILIYKNKKPDLKIDFGAYRKQGVLGEEDVLFKLFKLDKLMGQALEDAKMLYGHMK